MLVKFEKYHGAGNDFILIDNSSNFNFSIQQIAAMCHQKFGIGADGLILIGAKRNCDFEMKYFNADGAIGSMCGNGGRCAVMFSVKHAIVNASKSSITFTAYDGLHEAIINKDRSVKLSMLRVNGFDVDKEGNYILNTGSPHLVRFVESTSHIDVLLEGANIRNRETYKQQGINVNFVSVNDNEIHIRTYERGVEGETLSCGTGTVAAAIAISVKRKKMGPQEYNIKALGGTLKVYFDRSSENTFQEIWLEGDAVFVFEGSIEI